MNKLKLLHGVRVVDFTQALSGPYCTLLLADLGADVVKVEPPIRGDDSRHWGPPFVGPTAAYFTSVNRNKRSVTLDLKNEGGLRDAWQLISQADVFVENWRPGTAARLGLGAVDVHERFPRVVYCSISGFGQESGSRSGYDQIVQGTSGVMSLTGPVGEPSKWGVPVGDLSAGMFAATAILAAIHERTSTNQGRTLDIAMQDCLLSMLTYHAAGFLNGGPNPVSQHNTHATIAPYGLFNASDGQINICVGNDDQFRRMCSALGRPDLVADDRFLTNAMRVVNKVHLISEIEAALAGLGVHEALEALDVVGVPAGLVSDVAAALDDRLTQRRGMIVDLDIGGFGTGRVVNTPWKFDGIAPGVDRPPPLLGEHNHELFDHLVGQGEGH